MLPLSRGGRGGSRLPKREHVKRASDPIKLRPKDSSRGRLFDAQTASNKRATVHELFPSLFWLRAPSPPGLTSSMFVGDLENTVTHGNERGREAEARQSPDALARCQMATRPPPPLRSGRPVSHTPPSWTPTNTCTPPLFFGLRQRHQRRDMISDASGLRASGPNIDVDQFPLPRPGSRPGQSSRPRQTKWARGRGRGGKSDDGMGHWDRH